MKRTKRYIAALLLLVMGFTVIPAHVFHELFADHTDAAENHCNFYHKDLGRHVEEQQNHCDVFKANTPVYDAVTLTADLTRYQTTSTQYESHEVSTLRLSAALNIPARAPPVA
jgi:hypothetical protein